MEIHAIFDILSAVLGFVSVRLARRHLGMWSAPFDSIRFNIMVTGAAVGAFGLGTMNVWLSGNANIGRSVMGALLGGFLAVELWKLATGRFVSTGAALAPGFALGVAVGRLGCFFAGSEDWTYGTPTTLPWGVDFGDGIARHPVQLYEALSMAAVALAWWMWPRTRRSDLIRHGFKAVAAAYALQRFVWEFLKPYPLVLGPFNVFHFAAVAIIALVGWATWRERRRPALNSETV